jgi:cobalt-zinc-cadmium efflux system membrane fusion protein
MSSPAAFRLRGLARVLALCVLASTAAACRSRRAERTARGGGPRAPAGEIWIDPRAVQRIGLEFGLAEERDVRNDVVAAGRVAFDDTRVTHVFSPVAGRITALLAAPGQQVQRGAPLAIIASPDVGTASADLRKAEADLVAAQHDVVRQRLLLAEGAGTMRDVEQAVDVVRRAQAERDRARERVGLLNADSYDRVTQEYTLRAGIAGEVLARDAHPGLEVGGQYSGGTTGALFTIGDIDTVWVLADVYEADLSRVHPGAVARVHVVTWPDRTFTGIVNWVSGALDPQTHTARVRSVMRNPDRALRPEMYATVALEAPPRRALVIPRTALLRTSEATIVFVDRGRAPNGAVRLARVPVVADEDERGSSVSIQRGLNPGDRIVVSNGIQLLGML